MKRYQDLFNAIIIGSAIAVLLSVSGCSQNLTQLEQAKTLSDLQAALQIITQNDLDAALADAMAHNDIIAMACYPVLKKYVAQGIPGLQKSAGVFDTFQMTRDGMVGLNAGIPTDLRMGCAPLVQDERDLIQKLSAMAAGNAAIIGATKGVVP